jgi:Holliday junction resolvasome RuvABC endonuclease subunit
MIRGAIRVIGINPGTRYLGIAIFNGPELMDWRIKVLDGKWSKEKTEKAVGIISDFIERYEPNVLAIKKSHPSRRSENLLRLANRIKESSRRKKMKICQYSIKEIEKFFIEDGKQNKRNLIEKMANLYPMLHYDLMKEQRNRNPYYSRLFEAVALASVCAQKARRY